MAKQSDSVVMEHDINQSQSNTSADSSRNLIPNNVPKPSTDIISDLDTTNLLEMTESNTKPSFLVILITLASSISGFMFGYDTGYISSALVMVGTDLSNKVLTSGEKEFITSATSLGALIGALIGGILANIIGRKLVLLGSNLIFVIGTIIQLVSKTVWTMIAGRFVLGLGVGIASLIAPLMLSVKFTSHADAVVEKTGITGWGILVILGMVAYVACYAIGIGNSAWTGVELFSDVNVRSIGTMFATSVNWCGSLVIASTFLSMLIKITPTGTFSFFAGLCFVSFLFIYFLFPEVAGLELEETTAFLTDGFNVRAASKLSKERKKTSKFVVDSSA
ncbi:hypothetical protein QCA50_016860 [Cerrena zonata]|uniref:Major facilitator superfamily (MFS) profile domain-containing protein n=1 Tax=Cerrena zonata TaxID=2478898 RepID=A0AAW0FM69_9APHY